MANALAYNSAVVKSFIAEAAEDKIRLAKEISLSTAGLAEGLGSGKDGWKPDLETKQ